MTEPNLSMDEVRAEAERLVFKAGGWLAVANRMEITADSLKRRFMVSASVTDAREWLVNLRNVLANDDAATAP